MENKNKNTALGGAGAEGEIPVLVIEKSVGVVKIYPNAGGECIVELNSEKTTVDSVFTYKGQWYVRFTKKLLSKYETMTVTKEQAEKIRDMKEEAKRKNEEKRRTEVYKKAIDTDTVYVRDNLNGDYTCYTLCDYLHSGKYKGYEVCSVCDRAIRRAISEHPEAFRKEVENGNVFYKTSTKFLLQYIKSEEEAEEAARRKEQEEAREAEEKAIKEILEKKPTDLTTYRKLLSRDKIAEVARIVAKETGEEVIVWRYGEETPRGWVNTIGVILPDGREDVRRVCCH